MSTLKLPGWKPQAQPQESDDLKFHRQLLVEIVFGLYHRKKEILTKMSMPSQPIHLREIWPEFQSRRATLDSIGKWRWPWHTKRWIDRRVNECASTDFLVKNHPELLTNGMAKIVATTAGQYEPNPKLFTTS